MKEKDKILSEYISFKQVHVTDTKGLYNYKHFLSLFLNSNKKPLRNFTENDLIKFINENSNSYSIGTMNIIKSHIKTFLTWYFKNNLENFPNIKTICKRQRKERTYTPNQMLTKEDIEKLVQEEPETRWKAFFLLYFYGGFRPKEVCDLEWEHISFDKEGAYIRVYVKKNHNHFEKFVPENVAFYLRKLQDNGSRYVFPTKRKHVNTTKKDKVRLRVEDKPMTRSGVYQRLIPLAKRVLNKHVNPYILRHSIATILYNRDDLKDHDTAQQMGHSKSMKETYNNLSKDKIRERAKKIWIQAEDLPPEKKAELVDQIEILKKKVDEDRLIMQEFDKFLKKHFDYIKSAPKSTP